MLQPTLLTHIQYHILASYHTSSSPEHQSFFPAFYKLLKSVGSVSLLFRHAAFNASSLFLSKVNPMITYTSNSKPFFHLVFSLLDLPHSYTPHFHVKNFSILSTTPPFPVVTLTAFGLSQTMSLSNLLPSNYGSLLHLTIDSISPNKNIFPLLFNLNSLIFLSVKVGPLFLSGLNIKSWIIEFPKQMNLKHLVLKSLPPSKLIVSYLIGLVNFELITCKSRVEVIGLESLVNLHHLNINDYDSNVTCNFPEKSKLMTCFLDFNLFNTSYSSSFTSLSLINCPHYFSFENFENSLQCVELENFTGISLNFSNFPKLISILLKKCTKLVSLTMNQNCLENFELYYCHNISSIILPQNLEISDFKATSIGLNILIQIFNNSKFIYSVYLANILSNSVDGEIISFPLIKILELNLMSNIYHKISSLPSLRKLVLKDNYISIVNDLNRFPNLKSLIIDSPYLTVENDLFPLFLDEFSISNSLKLSDLNFLMKFSHLNFLRIHDCLNLSNFEPVKFLKNLKLFEYSGNICLDGLSFGDKVVFNHLNKR
ncbi:hypothetical protein RCL1_003554 [Eukaryota sp. TZLM3-RCL]